MAVNRYDSPAQAKFMNTYVPIPFEQLYTLGKQAKEDVDKAMNALSTTLDKWSEFRSPSEVDTKAWYDETLGKAKPIVNEFATNLDKLKSPEGKAQIYSLINNVDRAKLSTLMQSKEGLLTRQKVNQQLMLNGKYNPLWHDVDFGNYDTLKSGIYNDIAPLAYSSIKELTDPYVNNIKDSFIGRKGGFLVSGVTGDQIKGIFDANRSGILSTPQAQKHMQVYMQQNPDATADEAAEWFMQKAYTDNQKYIRDNVQADPYGLLNAKLAATRSSKESASVGQSRPMELYGNLAIKRDAKWNEIADKMMKDGEISPHDSAEMVLSKISSRLYGEALSNPNKAKELMLSQSIKLPTSELKYILNPSDPEAADVNFKTKGSPKNSNTIALQDFSYAVPMTKDGIPVAEISKEFILNNSTDIMKQFKGWLGSPIDKETRTQKLNDLADAYSGIVSNIVRSLNVGYMKPNERMQDYGIISNSGITQMPLATGKVFVSESQLDEILESNKSNFGSLSKRDIENILFKEGIAGKHIIGKKLKERPLIDDEEADEDYYEINIGLPILEEPAAIKAFDDAWAAKIFGGSASFKAEPMHKAVAFDNRRTNSNI